MPKNKPRFSLADQDPRLVELLGQTDHQTRALWARDCAERVLPYFEERYADDRRPRNALQTLQAWLDTGVFRMAVIRKASLDAHAAAREVGEDNPARAAARAAGQAVATAHVATHSLAAANYAVQAVYRASDPTGVETRIAHERDWQYRRLLHLTDLLAPRVDLRYDSGV